MEAMQSTTTTQSGDSRRKEGLMASTFESDVRAFAVEFNTPSVQQMLTLCEAGRITWAQAYEISREALAQGIASVA